MGVIYTATQTEHYANYTHNLTLV